MNKIVFSIRSKCDLFNILGWIKDPPQVYTFTIWSSKVFSSFKIATIQGYSAEKVGIFRNDYYHSSIQLINKHINRLNKRTKLSFIVTGTSYTKTNASWISNTTSNIGWRIFYDICIWFQCTTGFECIGTGIFFTKTNIQ